MTHKFITGSNEDTQKLGEKIGKELKNTNILALYGNLGSGKTTFVQGLAKGLGIKNKIISPTFIIVRKYEISNNLTIQQFNNFYHIDLYRVGDEKEVEGLGLQEILNDPSNIAAIEWPEKIEGFLPKKRVNIRFEYLNDDKRKIKIL